LKNPLILAIDIGSSSIRAALYDAVASPIRDTEIAISHSYEATPDGGSQMDAAACFRRVVSCIGAVLERSVGVKGDIAAVAACSFWHSLVGVDGKGNPTTKLLGWADTRSRKYSAILKKRFDDAAVHDRTGAHFHSSFWPAKLLWLRKEFPDVFANSAKWLSFSDYVAFRLFGEAATSISMASATGIFDQRLCNWDAELLRYLKLSPAQLPLIVETGSMTAQLKPAYAKRWPRLKAAKWLAAIGDGAADNIGSGCVTKDRAALMIGTSGAMRVAYTGNPPEKIPKGLWCYRIDRKRMIVGGALSDGGNLFQRLKGNLDLPKNYETQISRRGAAAHGLTFLPFFFGERSTGYNETALGAVMGLASDTDSIDILQAGLEAVAYRFAEILDALNSVAEINEIVASGGALRDSSVWKQIVADVLGRDLIATNFDESSLRGVAVFAIEHIETIMNRKISAISKGHVIKADRKNHLSYQAARKRHIELYNLLIDKKL
jgi:gluconokinase